jgi:hypothetical protein
MGTLVSPNFTVTPAKAGAQSARTGKYALFQFCKSAHVGNYTLGPGFRRDDELSFLLSPKKDM